MRLRLGSVVVLVGLLIAAVGVQNVATAAGGPTLTRVRIELSGTSDWQSVRFADSVVGAYFTEAQSANATVERGTNSILVRGVGSTLVSGTVSVLMEVTNSNAGTYAVALAKGKMGEAHLKLSRTNAATPVQILDLNNYKTTGDATVTAHLARSAYIGEGYAMPRLDARRLVLAFYYPWFQEGSFDKGPWFDTPTSAYDTNSSTEVLKQIDQAKNAGVDGFVVSWDDVGNHTDRFDMVLAAAQYRSMVASPVIELLAFKTDAGFNVTGIISTIKLALERSTNPAFLNVNGRPVVFVFGVYQMGATVWNGIVSALAAAGKTPFFVGEPANSSYALQGAYQYNPNGHTYGDLVTRYGGYMRSLRYNAQVNPAVAQRLWAASVSPGQNKSYFSPLFPQSQERNNGQRYDLTWGAALSTAPEWVLVTSWNEWYEATHIVPSKKFGSKALSQTAGWSSSFKNPSAWGSGSSGGGLLGGTLPLNFPVANKL
ncbi:MAG: hypothetical protein ACRDKS_10560 [Actinomycetota bacterium]